MEFISTSLLAMIAIITAIIIPVVAITTLNLTKKINTGLLQYYIYAVLLANGVAILLSGRNFTHTVEADIDMTAINPITTIALRITSIFAMVAAADQVVRFFKIDRVFYSGRVLLFLSFIFLWIANILIPSEFSTHGVPLEFSWIYSLILGVGLISLSNYRALDFVAHFRNATLIFCFISLILITIVPSVVLQTNYTQGYVGLPRFVGLTPHANLMGMIASLALWCLFTLPFANRKLNILFFVVGISALFLSQAKNIWTSFIISLPLLFFYQKKASTWHALATSRYKGIYILIGSIFLVGLVWISILIVFGFGNNTTANLLDVKQQNQLFTLTGRDQIWEVALSEWERSPIFGYGLSMFSAEYRKAIGMFFATSGHNQIYDNLARTGLFGVFSLVLHFVILTALSIIYSKKTHGLTLILVISLFLRMISDVPITLIAIGIDTLPYYLLLALLAVSMRFDNSKSLKGNI
jgi:O-antigen ligase